MFRCVYLVVLLGWAVGGNCADTNNLIEDHSYWYDLARQDLERALIQEKNEGIAKNVIVFIGDGMGLSTVTSSRIYGKTERGFLAFEKFPNIGSIKTYSANKFVPDSSSTATAMFSGIKANQKTAGVDYRVKINDCPASLLPESRLDNIFDWAQAAGKRTGFVTTTRVTHATPSALYVHTANRKWECESSMPQNATACKDIARQLVEDLPGRNINVIMGGGRQCMQSNASNRTNDPIDTWACTRKDGKDLIKTWKEDKVQRGVSHQFAGNNEELEKVVDADYVLGIFANGHVNMEHVRDKGPKGMPSLKQMTEVAVKQLQKGKEGFFLMVEGGLIDFAHHRGHARQAMSEANAFSDAIERTMELIKGQEKETLVIVTSDHSHPLIISGYADRTEKITGIAQKSEWDDKAYTTLLYGTGGPDNYKYSVIDNKVVREDPLQVNTSDYNYAQQSGVLLHETAHDGTDVLVYAKGPMSHLFHSVHEQTYIAHVIGYAAKVGPYAQSHARPSRYKKTTDVLKE